MKMLQLPWFGPPSEVLGLIDVPEAVPGAGQVLVDVEAAPLNPSDFMLVEGHYGVRPKLPAAVGSEGVGRISAVGHGVNPGRIGERVLLVPTEHTLRQGTWREQTVVEAADAVTVTGDADPQQLAMSGINPITAELLLRYAHVKPGQWIAQTAANSAVGAYVIQLAKLAGARTLNVVRRAAAVQPLLDAGADAVLVDGDDLTEQAAKALGGDRIALLLTALGGQPVRRLSPLLTHGAAVVSYASLDGEPVAVPPRYLAFNGLSVHGFWLMNWLKATPVDEVAAAYRRIAALTADGTLHAPVAATYRIEDFAQAVAHATREGRDGKVLFTFPKAAQA